MSMIIRTDCLARGSSDANELAGRYRMLADLFKTPIGQELQTVLFESLNAGVVMLRKKAITSDTEPRKD